MVYSGVYKMIERVVYIHKRHSAIYSGIYSGVYSGVYSRFDT